MFVEDVGIDPSHSLAVSEQKRAETVLIQPMNSGTDSQGNWSVFSSGQSRLLSHGEGKIPFGFL